MEKQRIFEAVVEEFNQSGYRFTMDALAKNLHISKKTLYELFADKETLFLGTIDYLFDAVQAVKAVIIRDASIGTVEKIRRVLVAMPEKFQTISFQRIDGLREEYPALYKKLEHRLESDWEPIIELLEKAVRDGDIRPIHIPVFKRVVEASIQSFLSRKFTDAENTRYPEALDALIDILMEGVLPRENDPAVE